jgi:hypothetical protein
LTNDATLLPGIDRRTRLGRRYQDIVQALAAEYGGVNPVALRELATLRFTLEREQGAIVAGDVRSVEQLVRLTNTIERKERALRAIKRQASRPPSLADLLGMPRP